MSDTLIKLRTNNFPDFNSDIPAELRHICASDTGLFFFWGSNTFENTKKKKPENQPVLKIDGFQRDKRELESALNEDVDQYRICWTILSPPKHNRYESLYGFARDNELAYSAKFLTKGKIIISHRTRLFTLPFFLSLDHKHPDTLEMIRYIRSNMYQEYLNGAIHVFVVMFVFTDA